MKSHEKATGCLKHECSKGKGNNHMPNKNEWKTKIRQKQDDRTTQNKIKARQGLMERHFQHANWKQLEKRNGKYENVSHALNP
jgi:hypothetical protein